MRRIKIGMVGGGQGSFIGAVHRIAARIDDRFDFVAGALSSDPARAVASAQELGISPSRIYTNFRKMAHGEAQRSDGIEAVSVVTPNHLHAEAVIAFLEVGIHVICDKPLTVSSKRRRIKAAVDASNARFFITHNYTGYPLIREALMSHGRAPRPNGLVQAEYAQDCWPIQ